MALLRILHVISSLAPESGGPPAIAAGIAGGQIARGHAVTIATVGNPADQLVPLDPRITIHTSKPDGSPRYAKSLALKSWLQQNILSFDFIHLHSIWQYPTFIASQIARKNNKKYVVLLNGMLEKYSVKQRSFAVKYAYWLWREKSVLQNAAALHCGNTAEIRKAVPWIASFPKVIIGNGVAQKEIAALPPRGAFRAAHPEFADRPLILFLSRLHPKKGLDRLLPHWHTVVQARPDVLFIIAGTGDPAYESQIDHLITQHNLQNHVQRVGQIVGPAKWQALVDADLFVLPSHQEGFSMAITEALAAGCVPIVTEECNYDELASHDCGIVIPSGDMAVFTQSTLDLLSNLARRTALAANGRQLVEQNYTWEVIAAQLEKIYHHAIARKSFPADGSPIWN